MAAHAYHSFRSLSAPIPRAAFTECRTLNLLSPLAPTHALVHRVAAGGDIITTRSTPMRGE